MSVEQLEEFKSKYLASPDVIEASWQRLEEAVRQRVEQFRQLKEKNQPIIPEISLKDIENNTVPTEVLNTIRERGVVIIRKTIPVDEVNQYHDEVRSYLRENLKTVTHKVNEEGKLDPFFHEKTGPQIYGVYWNKSQVQARQHPGMASARAFVNSLWTYVDKESGKWAFDPSREYVYADRTRVRVPGNISGLLPHVDGGSTERWLTSPYRTVYHPIFQGQWEQHNPWDGVSRILTSEYYSPNNCTVFRAWQGWLALTSQGQGDGTLVVVPALKEATAWFLLRPFVQLEKVEEEGVKLADLDPFTGAYTGRQHKILERWHSLILQCATSLPLVERGDTVWWHPDIIHAVEKEHRGKDYSSVFYIGAVPVCEKNAKYLARQRESFLEGKAGPDFPQEDMEVNFSNRGVKEDLSELGLKQMGFVPYSPESLPQGNKELIEACNSILGF